MRASSGFPITALALLVAAAAPAAAQDVEMLAEHYGTPLPAGYRAFIAANPGAFQFAHGRAVRLRERLRELGLVRTEALRAGPQKDLGPKEGAVTGTFRIPVLLGLFSNSPATGVPYPRDNVQDSYFGQGPGSITSYYHEVSGGRVALTGDVQDWIRSSLSDTAATRGSSGLTGGTTGAFILDLLRKMPSSFDWGPYDNDGPDGVANSGDDDGYVDALAVIHPTTGAECGGGGKDYRIWSHRWSLRYAAGQVYTTTTPRANGGFIKVDDYVVEPVYACGSTTLNQIGVFTHELGHAFGLPDLYDTDDKDGKHQGIGNWDLMSTGSWGCNGNTPELPCHVSAWSKMVLGWADVQTLSPDTDLGTFTLPAVETSGKIYRVDAQDGSGEFYLLENRQRLGFDLAIYNDGLLVWRISQRILDQKWGDNEVNAGPVLGVWLREADGLNELATPGCARGNAGDPFPFTGPFPFRGCGGRVVEVENRVFHAASNPSSITDLGTASGLTLLDIQKSAGTVSFRLSTRFTRVAVRSEGDPGTEGLFRVNGSSMTQPGFTYRSAPFATFTLEAAAGASLGQGVRRPFVAWADSASAPRLRTVKTPLQDLELVARYAGEQVEMALSLVGGQGNVAPGTFLTAPASSDLWFARGTSVTVQAQPRTGFTFLKWSGALAGQPNPATVTLSDPLSAAAEFQLIYKVSSATVRITAAEDPNLTLVPQNGTAPYAWTLLEGTLPSGLRFDQVGQLTGAPLETGSFPLKVEVTDGIGLHAEGTFTLEVVEPVIAAAELASKFLLAGPTLSAARATYVDRKGNNDGTYDLGDFRAWVLSHPGLPLTAPMKALVGPRTVVIPMTPGSKGEVRR